MSPVAIVPGINTLTRQIIGARTFDNTAGNGAVGAATYFAVTGDVLVVAIAGFCVLSLTGATATCSLGVTGNTAIFIAATTATDLATDELWVDATPTEVGAVALPAALKDILVTADIIAQIATAGITGGTLRISCYWLPISANGNLTLASGVT